MVQGNQDPQIVAYFYKRTEANNKQRLCLEKPRTENVTIFNRKTIIRGIQQYCMRPYATQQLPASLGPRIHCLRGDVMLSRN